MSVFALSINLQYFWTYWDDIPDGIGFAYFGPQHLGWLAGIAACTVIFSAVFTRLEERQKRNLLRALCTIPLCMDIYKTIVLTVLGNMEFQYVPLHLCGLALFIELLYGWTGKNFFGELTCVMCLPGAVAALIYPDWNRYPQLNFMNLHGFCYHGLITLIPVMLLVTGYYRPKLKRIWMPAVFLGAAVPVLYHVNAVCGTDFMFLNRPSTGSPFETIYEAGGYPAYAAAYAGVVALVILAMYGIAALIRRCRGEQEKE